MNKILIDPCNDEFFNQKSDELDQLHDWCREQTRLYYDGGLSKDKIDKLNSIKFPWEHYKKLNDEEDEYWYQSRYIDYKYREIDDQTEEYPDHLE